ncbi:hypothetical protein J6I90_09355 [Pseudidiomarina sp. 1APP75-32.1]|uniref:Uncharacterized protein n=1 Tax=Pseudidiomarina terrestris TaxID=2820060 RepID=A0AAW7R1N7_9GAMM|nr:hypothetical protein [Pseudidiomarina sp. 1APP75-32.1]MDN7125085.1 hypothetical protein [Pseudidiomarina sp. 1APP75-32.1]
MGYVGLLKLLTTVTVIGLLIGTVATASEFKLLVTESCSATRDTFNFECEEQQDEHTLLMVEGNWFGKEKQRNVPLGVLKDNAAILILKNPVLFDGTDTIHIFKETMTFYWVQTAYSTILGRSELTTKRGYVLTIE